MYRIFFIWILWSMAVAVPAQATPSFLGDDAEGWDETHYSVIVAKVRALDRANDDTWTATLVPMSTIAGKFDASEHAELLVRSYPQEGKSARGVKAGDTVLTAVIFSQAPGRGWVVPIVNMHFMPEGVPLCVIDGPADPRVDATLKRIQEARARGLQKAGASTRPATTRPAEP